LLKAIKAQVFFCAFHLVSAQNLDKR